MKPERNQPLIYPDESEVGYLFRLAHVNYKEIKDLGLRYPRIDDEEFVLENFLHSLETISNQRPEKHNLLYYWRIKGFTLPKWKAMFNTQFCPSCLVESHYHRTIWSLSHHTEKHRLLLLEKCQKCEKDTVIEA